MPTKKPFAALKIIIEIASGGATKNKIWVFHNNAYWVKNNS